MRAEESVDAWRLSRLTVECWGMKAAVLHGKESILIEEIEDRALAAGEVRLSIGAALTCGTDLKVYRRGYHARMIVPPSVFGHELAGTIIETGSEVRMWRKGDRVVVANSAPCDRCFFCGQGQQNLCDDLLFLNGAYAERIVVPKRIVAKNMVPLHASTQFEDAALTEPLACVVQGAEDLQLVRGERVLVIGSGPIGLMFAALAREAGCLVTMAGRGEERLAVAARLGVWRTIDVAGGEAIEGVYDVVFEAVGKPETWGQAIKSVRKGGRVNLFGGCPAGTSISLDTGMMHYSSLTLLASFHHTPTSIRKALTLIENGVLRAADFVDGRCALSELPGLFQRMAQGNRMVKTLVDVRR